MNGRKLKSFLEYTAIIGFFAFLVFLLFNGNRINHYLYLIQYKSIRSNGIELVGNVVSDGNMKGDYIVVNYTYKKNNCTLKTWTFEKGTKIGDKVPLLMDTTDVDEVIIILKEEIK